MIVKFFNQFWRMEIITFQVKTVCVSLQLYISYIWTPVTDLAMVDVDWVKHKHKLVANEGGMTAVELIADKRSTGEDINNNLILTFTRIILLKVV